MRHEFGIVNRHMRSVTTQNPKTVMIVDDDDILSSALSDFLSDEGLDVVTASNGEEALQFLNSNPLPDLIFTDMTMPEMSGAELVNHLRKNVRTLKVPVILSSAVEEVERIAGQIGAQGYLKKPFRLAAMNALIRAHMH
jgi:CheY-like chemotaxis protein